MNTNLVRFGVPALVASLCIVTHAWAYEPKPHEIIVQGTGEVTAQPDSVRASVGVQTQAKTVAEAREQNAQKMTAIRQQVQALNIPNLKLKTTNFSVSPITRASSNNSQNYKIVAYQVSNTLEAKVENAASGDLAQDGSRILDAALNAGANESYGLNFYLSKDASVQREAIKLAVKQARQTADVMAEAAGVTITGVETIESASEVRPLRFAAPMMAMAKMADAATPTPVEPGEQQISASVTVHYLISP